MHHALLNLMLPISDYTAYYELFRVVDPLFTILEYITMTTAARPTFEPARGGQGRGEKDLSAMSKQYSSRDLPSHTKLKYR